MKPARLRTVKRPSFLVLRVVATLLSQGLGIGFCRFSRVVIVMGGNGQSCLLLYCIITTRTTRVPCVQVFVTNTCECSPATSAYATDCSLCLACPVRFCFLPSYLRLYVIYMLGCHLDTTTTTFLHSNQFDRIPKELVQHSESLVPGWVQLDILTVYLAST